MNMPITPRHTARTLEATYATRELVNLSRADAVSIACGLLPRGWVLDTINAVGCVCLGLFGLDGDDADGTRWPVVFLGVERPENVHLREKRRLACVRLTVSEGVYSVRVGDNGTVDWSRYMGDRHGQPGPINGDQPGSTPTDGRGPWRA